MLAAGTHRVTGAHMRTPLLAALVGLSLVGCLVGESGAPGTGDDGTGSNPGPGPGTNPGPGATPKLDVTLDKPTISAELLTTNMVTVTLAASGGFSGSVGLVASAVDSAGAAIPGWTVTLDKATVDMAADSTATAVATVKIPSDSAATTGSVKIETTSSLGAIPAATSAVTVAKQLSIKMTLNGADCVYPAATLGTVKVTQGTKIRWVNNSGGNLTIHINGGIAGLSHQQGATPDGGVFEQTVGAASGTSPDWYCHTKNDPAAANPKLPTSNFQAVP